MAADYYKQWLGIAPDTHQPDLPPDHYTLLGLPHFCHHSGAVEISAKQRLEKLDKFAMLPERLKREAATRMMNEVATARVALSDPKHYQQYDHLIAKKLGLKIPDQEVPPPSNLLGLLEDDQAYELELVDEAPAAPTGVKPLDASLAEMDGPEIQVEADLNASRAPASAPIPFTTIIVALSVLFLLILGIVIGIVMFMGGKDDQQTSTQFQTAVINPKPADDAVELTPDKPANKPTASNPEDADLGQPNVKDEFDRLLIGNSYRVRATSGKGASIENQKLEITVGGSGMGESRVEYTPMQTDVPIQQVSFTASLSPKAALVVGLASGTLKLTIKTQDTGITCEARPGGPPGAQAAYPVVPGDGKNFTVRARRTQYNILWYINDVLVASSPSIDPRSTATVIFSLQGSGGNKAAIDNVQVWYPK